MVDSSTFSAEYYFHQASRCEEICKRLPSACENGASDLHLREKPERHFRSVASLGSSGFGGGIVLVLSIAVLVLVLVSMRSSDTPFVR
jgi:hypothetical protein